MRAQISQKKLDIFFQQVKKKTLFSWEELAINVCNVNPRTLRGWRSGKYTIPIAALEKLSHAANVTRPSIDMRLSAFWYVKKGNSLGGKRRQELHGDLGTPEGRRKGGLQSAERNRSLQRVNFLPRKVTLPKNSLELAEFIGILLGDGGVTPYQVTITLNRYDDTKYIAYVAKLCTKLFGFPPSLHYRKSVCTIIISRVGLVKFLVNMGMVIGSKVRHQVDIPE